MANTLLYKYYPCSDLALKSLKQQEIFFADSSELNDPLDARINFNFKSDWLSWYHFFKKNNFHRADILQKGKTRDLIDYINDVLLDEKHESVISKEQFLDFLSRIIFESKVLELDKQENNNSAKEKLYKQIELCINQYLDINCYSASFSKIFDNPLMWGHYANSYSGFCLGFTKDYLNIELANDQSKKYHFKKIEYLDNIDYVNFPSYAQNYNDNQNKFPISYEKYMLNKYKDWKYEREYRLIHYLQNDSEKYPDFRGLKYDVLNLKEIILGCKISQNNEDRIRKIHLMIQKQQMDKDIDPDDTVKIYKAQLSDVSYKPNITLTIQ